MSARVSIARASEQAWLRRQPVAGILTYPAPGRLERALDLLFPPVCVGCRRIGRWICERCWDLSPFIPDGGCERCGKPSTTPLCTTCGSGAFLLHRVNAVMLHEGIGREAVRTLKFHERFSIKDLMGRLMAEVAVPDAEVVVPVPLHPSRRRERGYDQARLLARVVAHQLSLPCDHTTLLRQRKTRQQALLDAAERERNVAGAFTADDTLAGRHILLVDDVFTTGATMEAATRALRTAGVDAVSGLAFARASHPSS